MSHEGVDRPIVYSLRIEGTEDRMVRVQSATDDAARQEESAEGNVEGSAEQGATTEVREAAAERDNLRAVATRNLPVLVARFDTAEHLLAMGVVEPLSIEQTNEAAYSKLFDESMLERKATIGLEVRVLQRSGQILASHIVRGSASELVVEKYLDEGSEPTDGASIRTKKSGSSFFDIFK